MKNTEDMKKKLKEIAINYKHIDDTVKEAEKINRQIKINRYDFSFNLSLDSNSDNDEKKRGEFESKREDKGYFYRGQEFSDEDVNIEHPIRSRGEDFERTIPSHISNYTETSPYLSGTKDLDTATDYAMAYYNKKKEIMPKNKIKNPKVFVIDREMLSRELLFDVRESKDFNEAFCPQFLRKLENSANPGLNFRAINNSLKDKEILIKPKKDEKGKYERAKIPINSIIRTYKVKEISETRADFIKKIIRSSENSLEKIKLEILHDKNNNKDIGKKEKDISRISKYQTKEIFIKKYGERKDDIKKKKNKEAFSISHTYLYKTIKNMYYKREIADKGIETLIKDFDSKNNIFIHEKDINKKIEDLKISMNNMSFKDGEENNDWFSDNQMDVLFNYYFGNKVDIRLVNGIDTYQHDGKTLEQSLEDIQLQQVLENSLTGQTQNTIIVPVNLGNKHWCALYIYFITENRLKPNVGYFDPFGNQIPPILLEKLKIVYGNLNAEDILVSPIKLQNDKYNCGPWVIAILNSLISSNGLQLPPENFNIESARYTYLEDYNKVNSTLLNIEDLKKSKSQDNITTHIQMEKQNCFLSAWKLQISKSFENLNNKTYTDDKKNRKLSL